MAEREGASTPNHLGADIPSGDMNNDEKHELHSESAPHKRDKEKLDPDEEEDEDMDALIDELESQDGQAMEDEEEETAAGDAPPIAEEYLQTDTRMGLTEHEVTTRRKKFGLNQMKEEKENLVLKFLGYFVGPIQFVMEVSNDLPIQFTLYRCCWTSIVFGAILSPLLVLPYAKSEGTWEKQNPTRNTKTSEHC